MPTKEKRSTVIPNTAHLSVLGYPQGSKCRKSEAISGSIAVAWRLLRDVKVNLTEAELSGLCRAYQEVNPKVQIGEFEQDIRTQMVGVIHQAQDRRHDILKYVRVDQLISKLMAMTPVQAEAVLASIKTRLLNGDDDGD